MSKTQTEITVLYIYLNIWPLAPLLLSSPFIQLDGATFATSTRLYLEQNFHFVVYIAAPRIQLNWQNTAFALERCVSVCVCYAVNSFDGTYSSAAITRIKICAVSKERHYNFT